MKKDNTKKKNNTVNYWWIVKISIASFIISVIFSFISETAIPNVNIVLGILLTIVFVFIGIIFDMIGVAVAASDESGFNSMASQGIRGGKTSVALKKNASKVSSFCNDVVGDICGIISGSTGLVVSIKLSQSFGFNQLLVTLITMGAISMLTIGGKAIVKSIAMKKSNKILFNVAKMISYFKFE